MRLNRLNLFFTPFLFSTIFATIVQPASRHSQDSIDALLSRISKQNVKAIPINSIPESLKVEVDDSVVQITANIVINPKSSKRSDFVSDVQRRAFIEGMTGKVQKKRSIWGTQVIQDNSGMIEASNETGGINSPGASATPNLIPSNPKMTSISLPSQIKVTIPSSTSIFRNSNGTTIRNPKVQGSNIKLVIPVVPHPGEPIYTETMVFNGVSATVFKVVIPTHTAKRRDHSDKRMMREKRLIII